MHELARILIHEKPVESHASARGPPASRDTYRIHGCEYDVVITIGDYAIDTMLAEIINTLVDMGFLDPPVD